MITFILKARSLSVSKTLKYFLICYGFSVSPFVYTSCEFQGKQLSPITHFDKTDFAGIMCFSEIDNLV